MNHPLALALAALAALGTGLGCKKACEPCTTESAASSSGSTTTSAAIDSLLAGVPGNAMAIGFLDLATPPWTYLTQGLSDAERAGLDKELRDYVSKHVGVDLSKVQYAVGYVGGLPPTGAVLIKTVGGTPTLPGATEHEGAKVWPVEPMVSVAMKGDTVVLGETSAVHAVLETLAQKKKSVVAENKALVDWLHAETAGAVVGVVGAVPAGLPLPPEVAGLSRFAVTLKRTGMRAVVEGDDAAITRLQGLADQALAMMLDEASRARDAAHAGQLPPAQGFAAILGAGYAKSYAAMIKPKREGNRLIGGIELPAQGGDAMMITAVVGILAAVAVPAFMDYMKKSKKSEPSLQLNRLAKLLQMHHAINAALPAGEAPLTPAEPCCSFPDRKCPPSSWDHPLWKELEFQIDEPHLFQYRLTSEGTTARAEAVGDLDCDGTTITYTLAVTEVNGAPSVMFVEPPPNSD